ncbi:MAG TPA: bifunctional 2-keto-4-hydroxyglutarate aldolase/2-keto-3-deoxy-6-phosphogluconate aldolase [Candidatus Limnocylindrales bacterium]|nr:bifunctional 2-keto-4-hydroxyglutarate aldolase/2-keto-3-deoxy-6-phosphogluconate aldolase [Candidatus Limnocylindrales bacterium]
MKNKVEQFRRMWNTGIVAVVRADSPDQALELAEAVRIGGVDIIEITLTVPGALEVLKALSKTYSKGEILLGAGTVLDPETARAAVLVGADFIVSPSFNLEVVKLCNRYQKICIPGCMTVTEIVTALEAGADIIKLFPGNVFGPSIIKTFKGPLPQAEFIPTGGVSLENVQEWINNGCIAVGVGGELTKGAASGDYRLVTETAKQFADKIKEVRRPL